MPTFQFPRITRSGACAACGFYPGVQLHTCRLPGAPRLHLGRMRNAKRDARNSAAVREKIRIDNELVHGL
jgi:hypothetical protein